MFAGVTDIGNGLRRLDELTQEEERMASAEMLKITHSVDRNVVGVGDGLADTQRHIRRDKHDVQLDQIDRLLSIQLCSIFLGSDLFTVQRYIRRDKHDVQLDQVDRSLSLQLCSTFLGSDLFTGTHLRDRFLRWLSPSDPSTNYNIARNAHHNGTAQWFLQGIYNQWKSSGSFLWVRGKRASFLVFSMLRPLTIPYFYSGFREKCALVCPSSTQPALAELTTSIQFLYYTRYHGPA